jgi:hypothetical protein
MDWPRRPTPSSEEAVLAAKSRRVISPERRSLEASSCFIEVLSGGLEF